MINQKPFQRLRLYMKDCRNQGVSAWKRLPVVSKLKTGVLAEPVLVGREHELERLMLT